MGEHATDSTGFETSNRFDGFVPSGDIAGDVDGQNVMAAGEVGGNFNIRGGFLWVGG